MKRLFLFLVMALLATCACRLTPPNATDIASTMVAQTAAAITQTAEAASPTPLPPTSTPQPTATITPLPSATPSITPTPGPFSFADDFSTKNKRSWSTCDQCEWKDGQFIVGPFPPGNNADENLNLIVCEVCEKHKYYHMAVDATFVEGQVDRFFGVVGPITEDHIYYLGISPWQAAVVLHYDYSAGYVKPLFTKMSTLVKASKATNHFEITVKPGSNPALVDVYYALNGNTFYVLTSLNAEESMVGLGMNFHSMTVAYDNFEYEELEFNK
jgi:hypothetical protein